MANLANTPESALEEEYRYRAALDETLSEAVVEAVASFTGRHLTPTHAEANQANLAPLYDSIDPDALDSLFNTRVDGTATVGSVQFVYCGCEVTVQSDGLVTVRNE